MSPATAPCARAPGGAIRAPGSQPISTVLAISGGRGPLAGWLDTWSRRLTAAGPVAHRARPARLQKMPKAGGFQPAGTPQMSRQRQTAVWGRQRQKKMEETQQHLLERLDSMTEILQRIDAKGLKQKVK